MNGPTHRLIATGELVFPQGYSPAELVALTAADELATAKIAKWQLVKLQRERHQFATFRFGAHVLQCDRRSRENIRSLARQASDGTRALTFAKQFRKADNTEFAVNAAAMLAIELALADFDTAIHTRAAALRSSVFSATTMAALSAINITTDWPS